MVIWGLWILSGVVTVAVAASSLPSYWCVVSGLILGCLGYELILAGRRDG